jgi:hypothetical protein
LISRSKIFLTFALVAGAALPGVLQAQFNFEVAGRKAQVHTFVSQGFAYSNQNNYLTMDTSKGSFGLTDFGFNITLRMSDKFRVGAQVYDRNIGHLGDWHPTVDWAVADYKVRDWFGIRGGKVKTALGLYNDTQDMDMLHTFALLPQAVYPTDLRDATIAHLGGDFYGDVPLKKLGGLTYTVYAGRRQDTKYGGYLYLLADRGIHMSEYGGLQYGADLKWTTPLKGLLLGASHMREEITGKGTAICASAPIGCQTWLPLAGAASSTGPGGALLGNYREDSLKDQTNFGYGQYTRGNLKLDAEYRRYWRDQSAWNGLWEVWADTRGWYTAASYRISKHLEVGSYYSRFTCAYQRGNLAPSRDTSQPGNHVYDKVVTARVDLTRYWNVKVEGHFMDGFGGNQSPIGFYTPVNPQGLKPTTNLLLIRTGFAF